SMRQNATKEECKAEAGHDQTQWNRYYYITKEECTRFSEAHPEWSKWGLIPANVQEDMRARVNTRLVAEGIPAVNMDVFKWRMAQLLRDVGRKYPQGSMLPTGMTSSSAASSSSSAPQPPTQSQSGGSTQQPEEEARPYDPVRDV
ncbi:hypothetical protein BCR34DRAFT_490283, partial [Clohesyomyces aquaticus]